MSKRESEGGRPGGARLAPAPSSSPPPAYGPPSFSSRLSSAVAEARWLAYPRHPAAHKACSCSGSGGISNMFAGEFASPYIDILKLFSKDWSRAELSGDTQQTIDKTIGKKCFTVGGITPASNYLALPKPALSQGLGLESPHLYLQLKLERLRPSPTLTL